MLLDRNGDMEWPTSIPQHVWDDCSDEADTVVCALIDVKREFVTSLSTAVIMFAYICACTVLGSFIRRRIPERYLLEDSRDVLKLASGMIATLVALVIGLLVSSSKSSYDQASAGVTQIGAKVILLDRVLERYGLETKAIRRRMSEGIANSIERL